MTIEREDFARVTNQEFDVFVGGAAVVMTLVSMEPFKAQPGDLREGFSLIFKSRSPVVLPQNTYKMRSRGLADARKVEVFIVPIGRDPDGIRYQAVFN